MAYDIITEILIVLAAAVLAGELFEQIGLPSVAGELLAGLALGPTILGVVSANPQTGAVSSIALFFVVLLIGFEMTTETVRKHIVPSLAITSSSFFLPLVVGVGAASFLFPFGTLGNTVVALALAVPSISIISVLVMEGGLIGKEAGHLILSSVTVTDILAFVVLAAILESLSVTVTVVVELGVFLAVFWALDWFLNSRPEALRRLLTAGSKLAKRGELPFALLILGGLLVAVILQDIGISYILGAFFAGLIVHDGLVGKRAFRSVSVTLAKMNEGFFIPMFFGFAGVEAAFPSSAYHLLLPLGALLVLVVSVGTYLTYKTASRVMKEKEGGGPRKVAFILSGRGAVGIVIGSVALNLGVLDSTAFSIVVIGTMVASVVVPVLGGRPDSEEQAGIVAHGNGPEQMSMGS